MEVCVSAGAAWHAEGRAGHKEVSTKHTLVYDAGAGRQLGEVIAAERVSTCEEQLMILNPGTWVESSQKMQLLSTKASARPQSAPVGPSAAPGYALTCHRTLLRQQKV